MMIWCANNRPNKMRIPNRLWSRLLLQKKNPNQLYCLALNVKNAKIAQKKRVKIAENAKKNVLNVKKKRNVLNAEENQDVVVIQNARIAEKNLAVIKK